MWITKRGSGRQLGGCTLCGRGGEGRKCPARGSASGASAWRAPEAPESLISLLGVCAVPCLASTCCRATKPSQGSCSRPARGPWRLRRHRSYQEAETYRRAHPHPPCLPAAAACRRQNRSLHLRVSHLRQAPLVHLQKHGRAAGRAAGPHPGAGAGPAGARAAARAGPRPGGVYQVRPMCDPKAARCEEITPGA